MKTILLLLLFCTAAIAQELVIPAKLLSETKAGPERYVGADAFGWSYTIVDNEFRKEKDGRILKYKALQLGELYRADLQNPLQIVLFYKKFNTVVLLDNQLNETARVNFSDIPEPIIAEATGLASQNRLWVYEATLQQIGLYDLNQRKFKAFTPPSPDGIKNYGSDYNYFFWIDGKNNFYAVDVFGKTRFLGVVPAYERLQVLSAGQLLLQTQEGLFLYNPKRESLSRIDVVEKSFGSFYYKDQILSIFTGNEIIHYKITLPE